MYIPEPSRLQLNRSLKSYLRPIRHEPYLGLCGEQPKDPVLLSEEHYGQPDTQGLSQHDSSQTTQQLQQGFHPFNQLWPDFMHDPVSGHLLAGMYALSSQSMITQDPATGQPVAGIQPTMPDIQFIQWFSDPETSIITVSNASIIYISTFIKLHYKGTNTSEPCRVQQYEAQGHLPHTPPLPPAVPAEIDLPTLAHPAPAVFSGEAAKLGA